MRSNAFKGVFAVFLSAALIGSSGCSGAPEVNAETLDSATAPSETSVSETTTVFSTTTIAITVPSEEKDDFSFRKGVWFAKSADSYEDGSGGTFWFVNDDGAYFRDRVSGCGSSIVYSISGNNGVFYSGEKVGDGTASPFSVSESGDTVHITYKDSGHVTVLKYLTDDIDGFRFYTENELAEMADAYYAAKHDGHAPTKAEASSEDDNTVLIQLYDDDSYSLNATSAWYFIDRFTGKGKDIDGRDIDLTSVSGSQNSSLSPITGVWWLKDKDYGGEIWVIQDNKAGYVTELINGIGYDFTYELVGSSVVFSYHGPTAEGSETFTLGDGEIILDESRKLTRLTDKSDGFVVYSNADLANKAAEYYASTHDRHFPAKAVWSIEDNDLVRIRLFNDVSRSSDALNDWYFLIQNEKDDSDWSYTEIARYVIDRFDGKGTDGDGTNVDISYTAIIPEKWSPMVAQRHTMQENGEVFGVRYLGYIDPSINELNDTVRRNLDLTGTSAEFPFVNEMPADRFVSSKGGQELYLIIPTDSAEHVKVCPQAAPDEYGTDLVTLLYDSTDGEPFLLKCNASEIYNDVKVIFADSTGEVGITEWYPQISGENGRVVTKNECDVKVHDFTDYEKLAGADPASNNTYGG